MSHQKRVDEIRKSIRRLATALNGSSAKQVQSLSVQNDAKSVATTYFKDIRPHLCAELDEAILNSTDELMQDLLEISQKHSLRATYRQVLKDLQKELNVVEVAVVTGVKRGTTDKRSQLNANERLIVKTLANMIPSAATSYEQTCADLQNYQRKSFRGTAAEVRESLREVLDHLAPDEVVTKQQGFRLDAGQKKPTMKQKVRFILRSRGAGETVSEPSEKVIEAIEEKIGALARSVYNRSSLSAHVSTSRKEVAQIKAYIDVIFRELLEIT